MSWPYALHSKFNPNNDYTIIDYSMTAPLFPDGSNFPCKGYQNDLPFEPVAEFVAGSVHNLTLAGSATHNGGSCQIALSYDNGATFRVIKSIIGGCPLVPSYDFTVPTMAPPGNALLAWTWQNLSGNREFYMNCAQINVVAAAARRRPRQTYNTFDNLPLIWKANMGGINDCATIEGVDVVYPHPGSSVTYGNGLSDSSPPTVGTCDAAKPYGKTYDDLALTPSLEIKFVTFSSTINSTISTPASYAASSTSKATSIKATTSTKRPRPVRTRSKASISSHAPRSAAMGDYPQIKLAMMTTPTASTLTVTIEEECETTATITINRPSQMPAASTTRSDPPVASPRPPYATGDPNGADGYLPCVPGTFLCTSRTTWQTCNYNDGTVKSSMEWVWGYERTVAAGMECLPFLSPYADHMSMQQSNSPSGMYRDDRYIRARPDGDCASDGTLRCTYEGYQFDICDQGGWVRMGSVAGGTICRDGEIVAA
ncbi:uncharacterized protein RCC_02504 [Ramularia collo-cygni]|uniref:Spore coat protein SP96 n=1 Tax=Ramularia collo-cygni TaxID=112498 RepID=A0A2D3V5A4_9PEZI|nr:uncharacterized protein RCC_02504 [Ramularia collo-cygni]CZT16669.1 uncharacterized protein RCC_02504 [Ramularia collo-cygni]